MVSSLVRFLFTCCEESQTNERVLLVIRSKPKDTITKVPKRDVFTVLPYLGLQSKFITKQLRSCIYKLRLWLYYLKIVFRNTHRIKLFFPYKNKLYLQSSPRTFDRRDLTELLFQ